MRLIARCLLVAAAASSAACATVAPYEREYLSRRGVDLTNERGEDAFRAHVLLSREGATPGATAGGGGCGCN
ncbi:MAG: DUF4266 domain-containing protein [Deltaproteobacteria bacterium]|nr:DUF4266 domain-containing protein [Deltaproteobacteria bacterium]